MASKVKSEKKDSPAYSSFVQMTRSAETLTAKLNLMLADKGLTESQFGIMATLLHEGPLFQRELADKLLKSGGNITMVVDNLEKIGYVKRERGDADRRYFTVLLTKKGKNLVEKVYPKYHQTVTEYMGGLTQSEQQELYRLCKKVEDSMQGK